MGKFRTKEVKHEIKDIFWSYFSVIKTFLWLT